MNEPMNSLVVLGGASWNTMIYLDELPPPHPATIMTPPSHVTAGSTGIGKALALKALGYEALLHAALGNDEAGEHLRRFCRERGLRTCFDIDPQGSSRHINLMDAQGERISILLFNGSPQPPVDLARLAQPIAQASTIFLNITASSIPLLPLVAESSAEVWVDLHDYDGVNPYHDQFIAQADVLQLSDVALSDPRPLMQRLVARSRLVVCTRGARGALALDADGNWHETPAAPARLVDSNGAGDAFFVALWQALREQREAAASALRFAAAAAALAIESAELVPDSLSLPAVRDRLRHWTSAVGR